MKAAREGLNPEKLYSLDEAVGLIKDRATKKFDETVELAMSLNVDPRHSDQRVSGVVSLPHGTGRTVRVAVFAKGDKAKEAKEAGADLVGAEDLAETIQKGEIAFDRCIATPDMMVVVGKIGKILGPKRLMPNPKLGTVTPDVAKAVRDVKGGQVEFRVEKVGGIIHAGVGKVSFPDDKLKENVAAFVGAIMKAKPAGAKGTYVKGVAMSSTMGPGVKIEIGSLL
jgi:large subunit ribosomal protein L1